MVITGRLVALAAGGVLVSPLGGAVVGSWALLLLVVVVLDLLLAGSIAGCAFERSASPSVRLSESGDSVLTVTNSGRRAWRGELRDAWVPSAGAAPRVQQLAMGRGERRRLVTTLTPTRRGTRAASAVTVRSYGPLHLAARQRRLAIAGSVRVLPPFTARRFLPEKLSRLRQLDGAVLVRHRGQGSEFDSLRTYVGGDDVRSIDWRATARSSDVMVRTWRPERDRQLVLALDTGRSSASRIGDEPRLDAALDAGLLLGAVAARAGDRVSLVAADVRLRARVGASSARAVLPALVSAMTELEPALVETDLQLLVAEILRCLTRRSLVVLFTDLGATSSELVAAVRWLSVRHQVVVAAVSDPRLAELAAGRDGVAELYAAAAAELALGERRAVADRLTGLGVTVVDAGPADFASRVSDAYLDLKAAGRL
jgi:uncharacterized protein (DUF58 family)